MSIITTVADSDREELTRLVRLGVAYFEECVFSNERERSVGYYRRVHATMLAKVTQVPLVCSASLGGQVTELFESVVAEGLNAIETFPEAHDLPRGAGKIHARLADIAHEISYGH
ncbi:hypothetical protein [Brevibacterium aurantiacum]|uniref:Uncharacterized protein n=1 Tax=Brevibacterium aurantiacum TaxID=273384 RepID=A0A2H1KNL5_BREAU|nr:hypothetical protein [Brevibacterium aurantiacum]SMY01219.1 hypothetical protein BAURA63_03518 [Brevibacterium aurantiacum]